MITMSIPRSWLLTANQRLHWAEKSQRTKWIRTKANALARGHGPYERATIRVSIMWPDRRRRDRHNLYPTIKAAIDGFVDAGVIIDDSDDHLDGPHLYTASERCQAGMACELVFTIDGRVA